MRLISILALGIFMAAGFYRIGIIHGKEEIRTLARDRAARLSTAIAHNRRTLELLKRVSSLQSDLADLAARTEDLQARVDNRCVERVTVTAYSPRKQECDSDPLITASMRRVRAGTVAVSRDLFERGWVFGKKVYLKGLGVYEIQDLMHSRYSRRMDVFFWDRHAARQFGRKETLAALIFSADNQGSSARVASLD
jgi:3D (Asp-Asp-Asp) domain-containing protein